MLPPQLGHRKLLRNHLQQDNALAICNSSKIGSFQVMQAVCISAQEGGGTNTQKPCSSEWLYEMQSSPLQAVVVSCLRLWVDISETQWCRLWIT